MYRQNNGDFTQYIGLGDQREEEGLGGEPETV